MGVEVLLLLLLGLSFMADVVKVGAVVGVVGRASPPIAASSSRSAALGSTSEGKHSTSRSSFSNGGILPLSSSNMDSVTVSTKEKKIQTPTFNIL